MAKEVDSNLKIEQPFPSKIIKTDRSFDERQWQTHDGKTFFFFMFKPFVDTIPAISTISKKIKLSLTHKNVNVAARFK